MSNDYLIIVTLKIVTIRVKIHYERSFIQVKFCTRDVDRLIRVKHEDEIDTVVTKFL